MPVLQTCQQHCTLLSMHIISSRPAYCVMPAKLHIGIRDHPNGCKTGSSSQGGNVLREKAEDAQYRHLTTCIIKNWW